MARHEMARWDSDPGAGRSKNDRRGGPYQPYLPDPLVGRPLVVGERLAAQAAQAERAIYALIEVPNPSVVAGISRFLLRSEAIASSLIEGIAPAAGQVALAELAQEEPVKGFSEQAALVANNITVLRRASRDLVETDAVTVEDIVATHTSLLPDERHHGLRTVQNWIGGSNWHPLDAAYVPPPPEQVDHLMADLVRYLNGSVHAPLIQAGLLHAQFETIHPFTDGNGRLGRALIHTVLARRRMTPAAVVPISMVLSTLRDSYLDGLTAYRYVGASNSPEAIDGTERWLEIFLNAATEAALQARQLATDVEGQRKEWTERHTRHRESLGLRAAPRSGSAVAQILELLPEMPVMTARTAERTLGVTYQAARSALDELADAGILSRKSVDRGTTAYLAREVLDLITYAERRLGSTRFDTTATKPAGPVPARPDR